MRRYYIKHSPELIKEYKLNSNEGELIHYLIIWSITHTDKNGDKFFRQYSKIAEEYGWSLIRVERTMTNLKKKIPFLKITQARRGAANNIQFLMAKVQEQYMSLFNRKSPSLILGETQKWGQTENRPQSAMKPTPGSIKPKSDLNLRSHNNRKLIRDARLVGGHPLDIDLNSSLEQPSLAQENNSPCVPRVARITPGPLNICLNILRSKFKAEDSMFNSIDDPTIEYLGKEIVSHFKHEKNISIQGYTEFVLETALAINRPYYFEPLVEDPHNFVSNLVFSEIQKVREERKAESEASAYYEYRNESEQKFQRDEEFRKSKEEGEIEFYFDQIKFGGRS